MTFGSYYVASEALQYHNFTGRGICKKITHTLKVITISGKFEITEELKTMTEIIKHVKIFTEQEI